MGGPTFLELAARCEAASGPDRLLDAEIVVALDLRPEWCRGYGSELWIDTKSLDEPVIRINTTGKRSPGHPPMGPYAEYTASLDAAMTLVPSGWNWAIYAIIGKPESVRMWSDDRDILSYSAATPALALCAAALRALASQGGVDETA